MSRRAHGHQTHSDDGDHVEAFIFNNVQESLYVLFWSVQKCVNPLCVIYWSWDTVPVCVCVCVCVFVFVSLDASHLQRPGQANALRLAAVLLSSGPAVWSSSRCPLSLQTERPLCCLSAIQSARLQRLPPRPLKRHEHLMFSRFFSAVRNRKW